MRQWKRLGMWAATWCCAALLAGCGEDPTTPPPDDTNQPPPDLGPFETLDIFLRPFVVQHPSPGGGLPTPTLVEHYLAAFYQGGTELASFDWTVPASVGTVEPKAPTLSRTDATVTLRLRPDGDLPLGFFDISAHGTSGTETGDIQRRFAVVENTWMKHVRAWFRGTEPDDLALWPTFLASPTPGAPANADTILYVENTSATTTRLRRIPAFTNLNGIEPSPGDVHLLPQVPENNNYDAAPKIQPDVSPAALGRREILFSSQMDPDYPQRCSGGCAAGVVPPYRLWVVKAPDGLAPLQPRMLTRDSTFVRFGTLNFYAFDYMQARWDPKATNPRARIAFLSDLAGSGIDLWTAELVDRAPTDARSDTLESYHRLTQSGDIGGYDWHPDGTRLCILSAAGLQWIDANTGARTAIPLPPGATLQRIATPAVFWRPGEHTLIAFQAQAENLSNLYVLDVEDQMVTRLLPFSMPVTTALYPRWHPTAKRLIYVSDYTVEAWANTTEGLPRSDRLNPRVPDPLFGMRRTLYPSVWVVELE